MASSSSSANSEPVPKSVVSAASDDAFWQWPLEHRDILLLERMVNGVVLLCGDAQAAARQRFYRRNETCYFGFS
jgi:hypothetical protein